MKRRVRLTEGDLHRIVKQSVKRVLRENVGDTISNDVVEKLSVVLTSHYSMHEADAIERDIFDVNVPLWDFEKKFNSGYYEDYEED